jgi:hypothetical protein
MEYKEKKRAELNRKYREELEGVIGELCTSAKILDRNFGEMWKRNPEEVEKEVKALAEQYERVARSISLWLETEPEEALAILKEIEF